MKHMATALATSAIIGLTNFAQATELKMSHVRPQGATIDVELRDFASKVSEATGGDVTIEIFPASALARLSQSRWCIGPKNLRIFFCNKDLSGSRTGSDANRLYLRSIEI